MSSHPYFGGPLGGMLTLDNWEFNDFSDNLPNKSWYEKTNHFKPTPSKGICGILLCTNGAELCGSSTTSENMARNEKGRLVQPPLRFQHSVDASIYSSAGTTGFGGTGISSDTVRRVLAFTSGYPVPLSITQSSRCSQGPYCGAVPGPY